MLKHASLPFVARKNGTSSPASPYDVVVQHGSRQIRNPGSRGGTWYMTSGNRLRYGTKARDTSVERFVGANKGI